MSTDNNRFDMPDDGLNLDEYKKLLGGEVEPAELPDDMPLSELEATNVVPEGFEREEPASAPEGDDGLDEFRRLVAEPDAPAEEPSYDFTQLTRRVEPPVPVEQPAAPQEEPKKSKKEKKDKTVQIARRQRTGCMGALIFFVFIVGVSTLLAVIGWIAATDVLALGKEDVTAVVEVTKDDDVKAVAAKLEDAGIIKYPWLFRLFGVVAHADEKIVAGSFELNTTMDYRALIAAMGQSSATRLTVDVTIPEGYTLKQILQALSDNGVAELEELQDTAANYDFEYSFLQEQPPGRENRLEGYLFPDTYTFYVGENTVTALNKMLSNFNNKFDSSMRDRAAEMGYSMHEILTIASLIEKEAAADDERATIASVIYNRLNSDSFPYLQIDASIQYVLPEGEIVTQADYYSVDDVYNTYLYEGLPPGPIACPGKMSINAALHPEDTGYYYYALGPDGKHKFSATAEEHDAFVAQMQQAA